MTPQQHGQRLDNYLLKLLKTLPKSHLYRIIRKGEVRVNKKRVKPDFRLSSGDLLRLPPLHLESTDETPVVPKDLLNRLEQGILFENDAVLVINKPNGIAVHSGSGLRFGVIDAMRQLRPETDVELVHRLDRDTSGCLILAKNRPGLLGMQRLLQANRIRKTYRALVKGHWPRHKKIVDLPLLRQVMPNGERRVYVDERGQHALTQVRNVEHGQAQDMDYSLLEIDLKTGRTHQIRVHCQAQGHEIAGDDKYGDRTFNQKIKKLVGKRLMLHAHTLEISENDQTGKRRIVAPLPTEFIQDIKR